MKILTNQDTDAPGPPPEEIPAMKDTDAPGPPPEEIPAMKDTDALVAQFGPCGLYCASCFAYEHGPIRQHAAALREKLGNFDIYADRFVTLLEQPVFQDYPVFSRFLAYLSESHCPGCRNQVCPLFPGCHVRDCAASEGVLFCHECNKFPCNQTGFDEHLLKRWERINRRIRQTGLTAYHASIQSQPRYL